MPGDKIFPPLFMNRIHSIENRVLQSALKEDDILFVETVKRRVFRFYDMIFNKPKQQIFVRISYNMPDEETINTEPVKSCLDLIADVVGGRDLFSYKEEAK